MGSLGYQLCATFEAATQTDSVSVVPRGMTGVDTWQHGEGRQCFTGKIDPDFYKPLPK
jgi:hypothetical protein